MVTLVVGKTHQVKLPDSVVLCDGEGLEGTIECSPSESQQELGQQPLQVVQPYAWHLVHVDQSPLVRVVQRFDLVIVKRQATNFYTSFVQVGFP